MNGLFLDIEQFSNLLSDLDQTPGVGVDIDVVTRFAQGDLRLLSVKDTAHCDS